MNIQHLIGAALGALTLTSATFAQTLVREGPEFLVNTSTANDQLEPSVAALSGGGFVITWTDDSRTGGDTSGFAIRAQRYDANGAPQGTEFLVNTTTDSNQARVSVAALSGGGFVIAWQDNSQTGGDTSGWAIRAQRYDANGAPQGTEFLVNTTTVNNQQQPSVAALSGGGFVIAWNDSSNGANLNIRAQRYDANGAPQGTEFLVNTTTANNQDLPSVAALSGGGFIIAWTDSSGTAPDTSGTAIRAQRYDANGVAQGTEFLVNTTTADNQRAASVAALSGGGFVIAWQDGSAGNFNIRAQRYDANGAPQGPELLVNTTTANDQFSPSVAALSGGGFVIAWDGNSAGNFDIRAQRYDTNGAPQGTEFLANTTTAGNQQIPSVAALSGGGFVIAWQDDTQTPPDTSGWAIRAQRFSVTPPEFLALNTGGDFTGQTLASEVGATLSGDVVLDFGLADAFLGTGAGAVVRVTFTLTNATFSSPVPTGAWTPATNADCGFGAPVFDGGAGDNSVQFENTGQPNRCTGAGANDGFITLPITVTDNGSPVSVNVTFTPTVSAGTYAGFSDDLIVMQFAPAFEFDIARGAAGSGQFDITGTQLLGSGILGVLSLADFPNGIEAGLGVALVNATDIAASAELTVTFPGGVAGIDTGAVAVDGTPCIQGVAPSDNVFTCALGGGDLDALVGGSINITIDDDSDPLTSVTAQQPTAVLTVTPGAGNTVAGASGNLADIELDDGLDVTAINNSGFAWVRFGSGGTQSNFRIALNSAAQAAAVTEVHVEVMAGNGVPAGIVILEQASDASAGFRVQGATITFNSNALGAVYGASGNADITSVSLQHDETALLAATVSAFPILRQLVNRNPGNFVATPSLE
jgi:hypothetical protein